MKIETKNLVLIACNQEILQKAIEGNSKLAAHLQINVPENWSIFGARALQHSLNKLNENDAEINWWSYLPIHKTDNKLIGLCGYKGQPSENGMVEIGYEIMPNYQNKGLATELAKALIDKAFKLENVTIVQAHTLGETNASTKVLENCGFQKTDEVDGGQLGTIWKWELKKTNN